MAHVPFLDQHAPNYPVSIPAPSHSDRPQVSAPREALRDLAGGFGLPQDPRAWERVVTTRLEGLAEATRASYLRYWNLWREYQGSMLAASPSVGAVTGFIDFLSNAKQWKVSSIRTALGGLACLFAM